MEENTGRWCRLNIRKVECKKTKAQKGCAKNNESEKCFYRGKINDSGAISPSEDYRCFQNSPSPTISSPGNGKVGIYTNAAWNQGGYDVVLELK